MKHAHHLLRRLFAVLIGIVFLGSGLLKMLDPVGTRLIVTEYVKFFHLAFLIPAAKGIGLLLAFLEATVGTALIMGVYRKLTAAATSLMVAFFTLVTLILLVGNAEMDCGCFGEWIHLTHFQSFLKNIVLVLLCLGAFLPFRHFGATRTKRLVAFWVIVPSLLFNLVYALRHLPLLDFTEFAPGAELYASLDEPYQAQDGYMASYIYERGGQRGSFTLDHLPDSTWTFVGVDTVYRNGPKRNDAQPVLSFRDAEGVYQDDRAAQGRVMVFSVYDVQRADWDRIGNEAGRAQEAGAMPLVLAAATPEEVDRAGVPWELAVYYADYKTLVTLNRANGGATYFYDGELIAKWAPVDFPDQRHLVRLLGRDPVEASTDFIVGRRLKVQGFLLYLIAVMTLL
ncbi:MAG: hypothetical protein IJ721_06150 [Bacteroidales bacterium]|nr:hypothetical protein [Bacteroidales bacterium]